MSVPSVYQIGSMDTMGVRLDGGKTYTVTLPGPMPAVNFWSFMVYDVQTWSILQADKKTGGVDSKREGMNIAPDGSVAIYFSPQAPKGQDNSWVQTMSDKFFYVLLRLYGPEQAWFDKSWKPGDFEAAVRTSWIATARHFLKPLRVMKHGSRNNFQK
ncbi:MAG: DUF1214 domain-containing protein [Halioglobus sp.]